METSVTKFFVRTPNPRPTFHTVALYLWGEEVRTNSDGNCAFLDDPNWTELTLENRASSDRVDIDPILSDPLTLVVRSSNSELAARAAYYLARHTDGVIAEFAEGEFKSWQAFETLGKLRF